jgi:hypothetical protein
MRLKLFVRDSFKWWLKTLHKSMEINGLDIQNPSSLMLTMDVFFYFAVHALQLQDITASMSKLGLLQDIIQCSGVLQISITINDRASSGLYSTSSLFGWLIITD